MQSGSLAATACAVLLAASCQTEDTGPPTPETKAPAQVAYPATRESVTELVHDAMEVHGITGLSLALVDGQEIAWAEGFGHADRERDVPATADTVYRVGSIAKVLTAIGVLQLAEMGALDIDAPLHDALPQLALKDGPPLTVRQVMAHQSGLPSDWLPGMWHDDPPPWTQIVDEIRGRRLTHPPRTVTSYSNLGYTLLGHAIEEVSGLPFVEFMQGNVLGRLGMKTATFAAPDPTSVARGYRLGLPAHEPALRLVPAGGLTASVRDLAQLVRVMFSRGTIDGRTVLSPRHVDEMLRRQNTDMPLDLDVKVGLAWTLTRDQLEYAGRVAWQTGWTPHFHAQVMLMLDHELGVVVLSNSRSAAGAVDTIAVEALQLALAEKVGIDLPDPAGATAPPTIEPSAATLARHAGRYATDNATLDVRVQGATLRSTSRAGTADLIPLADETFEARGLPGLRLSFERIAGRDLMVARQHGVRGYLAQRVRPRRIPWTWKRRLGRYEVVRSEGEYELTTPPRLYVDEGLLILGFEFNMTDPPTAVTMVLEPVSANRARIAGLGRGKGEIVSARRSSLFWAGYELRRVRRE